MSTPSLRHKLGSWVAVAMLVASLGYALYLYPGPETRADTALALGETAQKLEPPPSPEAVEAIRVHHRRTWITSFLLFLLGSLGSASWLRAKSYRSVAAGVGVACLLGFVAVFLVIVIPANAATFSTWLPAKLAEMQKFAAIQAWSFMVAEIHRFASLTLALLTLAMMIALAARKPVRQD